MSAIIITPGKWAILDPNDSRVLTFDWDAETLGTDVTIATSTFTLTALKPTGATGITKDNEVRLTAAQATAVLANTDDPRTVTLDNRMTQLRLVGGGDSALGQMFELANKIVTNESPAQTKEQSIILKVEQR